MNRRGFLSSLAALVGLGAIGLSAKESPKQFIGVDLAKGVDQSILCTQGVNGFITTNNFNECGSLDEKVLEDFIMAMGRRNTLKEPILYEMGPRCQAAVNRMALEQAEILG